MACLRRVAVSSLLAALGCHADAQLESPEPAATEPTFSPSPAAQTRELALRYHLALQAFNRGAYEDAAHLFTQVLLEVPQDPAGDALRHLLIQHIGWAMLGAYDVHGDVASLDVGEGVLERYVAKHEELLPEAAAARADIYALMGEYQLRRAEQPPPDAHAQLEALVEDTRAGFEQQLAQRQRQTDGDAMVRVIEVETIPWAKFDDPQVRMFFALSAGNLGAWKFDSAAGSYNPTRVLVRGRVHDVAGGGDDRKQSYALLRAARPELGRCYEQALVRGAELFERVELELGWVAGTLGEVDVAAGQLFDSRAEGCVRAALHRAAQTVETRPEARPTKLSLTFFVQFEQRGPSRADFGTDYMFTAEEIDVGSGVQVR